MQAAKANTEAVATAGAESSRESIEGRGQKIRTMLKARLGREIYDSWFTAMEFDSFDGRTLKVSVPVKFVRNWIHEHYSEPLLQCARAEFSSIERAEVVWRQPGAVSRVAEPKPSDVVVENSQTMASASAADALPRTNAFKPAIAPIQRTSAGGLEVNLK